MRTEIAPIGAGELTYEIRNIVAVGEKLQKLGVKTYWENIGDPVVKGEQIPLWLKEVVAGFVMQNASYGYAPTRGILATREFLAAQVNSLGGTQIGPDDILFFNGLGDAISKVYGLLRRTARVVIPSPSYTTHSSGEASHAGDRPVSYRLDPHNHWFPDLEDLENRIKYNPAVAAILIINPDNPTGAVFPEYILRGIVALARKYELFIICDEVYQRIVYNGQKSKPLAEIIGEVPALNMRGISKEMPWPGSRCGWIEFYNTQRDPMFQQYVTSILNAKMLEVCSTTLPQLALPAIITHPEYDAYLAERVRHYERNSNIAYDILKEVDGLLVNRTNGAFYMSVVFVPGALNSGQSLPIAHREVRDYIEALVAKPGLAPDKRFVYYLLGSTGICVVPLSSFATEHLGFRTTLLERDEERFRQTCLSMAASIRRYLAA